MKYRVSDLKGELLDLAVAKAEGVEKPYLAKIKAGWHSNAGVTLVGKCSLEEVPSHCNAVLFRQYSTNWSHGGPIIDSANLTVATGKFARKVEYSWWAGKDDSWLGFGDTPLVAAMRAYVILKFGTFVEL